ncbi:unnamed protein product [Gadus morhua 'NCC']
MGSARQRHRFTSETKFWISELGLMERGHRAGLCGNAARVEMEEGQDSRVVTVMLAVEANTADSFVSPRRVKSSSSVDEDF